MVSKMRGFDSLMKKIDRIGTAAGEFNYRTIPLVELLSPAFFQANMPFDSFQKWLEAGGIVVNSWNDLDENLGKLDAFVVETSGFQSWSELLSKAIADYCFSRMGL